MSVRQAMLALLEEGPKYGYQLRAEFEERTGSTWPLNVGQVYTTLSRLERDGLVVVDDGGADHDGPAAPDAGDRGQVSYRITEEGSKDVREWFASPVARTQPARDELAIKLAIAVTVPGIDIGQLVQQQRTATMSALQGWTRLKRASADDPVGPSDLARSLVVESLVFDAEAELRWLDHCEQRLRRAASRTHAANDLGETP